MKRYASRVIVNGKRIRKSHFLWNKRHPNDPIKPGEVVHHKDENKKNDKPNNHQKMTDAKHRSLHSFVGVKALQKRREENPILVRKAGQKSIRKFHKVMTDNPVKKKEWVGKMRAGTIRANKARKGETRSKEFKKGQSEMMCRVWRKRKQVRKITRRYAIC